VIADYSLSSWRAHQRSPSHHCPYSSGCTLALTASALPHPPCPSRFAHSLVRITSSLAAGQLEAPRSGSVPRSVSGLLGAPRNGMRPPRAPGHPVPRASFGSTSSSWRRGPLYGVRCGAGMIGRRDVERALDLAAALGGQLATLGPGVRALSVDECSTWQVIRIGAASSELLRRVADDLQLTKDGPDDGVGCARDRAARSSCPPPCTAERVTTRRPVGRRPERVRAAVAKSREARLRAVERRLLGYLRFLRRHAPSGYAAHMPMLADATARDRGSAPRSRPAAPAS
jgi:hypothetical protein